VRLLALHLLFVDGAYHRKGVGSLLLQEVIRCSGGSGGRVWLTATPQGQGVYAKHGWKIVEQVEKDLVQFGGEGVYVRSLMVREDDKED